MIAPIPAPQDGEMDDDLPFGIHNLRKFDASAPQDTPSDDDEGYTVDLAGDGDLDLSKTKNVLTIEHPDGSITINLGNANADDQKKKDSKFADNLAMVLSDQELSSIAGDLIEGIRQDDASRDQWLQDRARGIDLLGIKLEEPRTNPGSGTDGMSTVRHPMLLEAVIRFQANAMAELLPADGPVKVRVDNITQQPTQMGISAPMQMGHNGGPTLEDDDTADQNDAEALEKDMNHYLTKVAKEYYPDFDRMLFMLGFGGTMFRKVYNCPIRRRPVSEMVDAKDIIVNNASTDLANAGRITHVVKMRTSTMKRMQILGVYRDVPLDSLAQPNKTAVDEKVDDVQGVQPQMSTRPEDQEFTLYECYCELDIPGFEHKHKGKATGLRVPYKVTLDSDTQQILEIRRNWLEGDEMALPKAFFVQYSFVPGIGLYSIGLLHILGNPTIAATGAWRELLDAGMFASFPGFLYAKSAARQDTNEMRVPPGGGRSIDTMGMPIGDAVMPLPYKEPSAALMQLTDNIVQTGQRLGGTAEINVGEGRQDAPVGTTIALIEQATKPMDAVHKRMHRAQGEEYQMLAERFKEDPEAFWRFNKKPTAPWDRARFLRALENEDLVPAADPNTSSHMMRIMKCVAVKQLQQGNPAQYDGQEVDKRILKVIGWENPESMFVPPQAAQAQQDPKAAAQMAAVQQKAASDQAKNALDAERLQLEKAQAARDAQKDQIELAASQQQAQADAQSAAMEHERDMLGLHNDQLSMQAEAQERALDVAKSHQEAQLAAAKLQQDGMKAQMDNATKIQTNTADNQTATMITQMEIDASAEEAEKDRKAQEKADAKDRTHQEKIEKHKAKTKNLSTGRGLTNNPTPSKK
jgi:hypothetical protein